IAAISTRCRRRVGQHVIKRLILTDLAQSRVKVIAVMEEYASRFMRQLLQGFLLTNHALVPERRLLRQYERRLNGIPRRDIVAGLIIRGVQTSNINRVEDHTHSQRHIHNVLEFVAMLIRQKSIRKEDE